MAKQWTPEKKAILQITLWTVSILTGLTLLNFLFVLHTVGPGLQTTFSRNVASIPPAEKDLTEYQTPLVKINCLNPKKIKKIETKASTARLKLFGCLGDKSIINQTNKNQAHLFALSKKEWTSDFIFLSPGPNRVAIQVAGKDYLVEITRQKEQVEDQNTAL